LLAVAEQQNIHSELIPRIATGFCSGMARTGGMCGAVSGGIMAIGLSLGRNEPSDDIDACYQAVKAFMERFSKHYHALNCVDLTCVDLGTPDGQAAFRLKGQIHLCTEYVESATRWALEVVSESVVDQD
jgi:C_GCAxxG_C_C family probable redox protein